MNLKGTNAMQERRARFERIKSGVVAVVIYRDERFPPPPGRPTAESMVILGSGFIVSEDGWIATNHHVVRSHAEAQIRYLAGEGDCPPGLRVAFNSRARADTPHIVDNLVVRVANAIHDPGYDISLLKVSIPPDSRMPISPLTISSRRCGAGDLVVTCGFPLGWELQSDQLDGSVINASFSTGMVSSENDPRGGPSRFSLDMIVNRGNSGGPICLVDSGEVVGVAEERTFRPLNAILNEMGLDLPPHVDDRIGVPVGRGRGIHVDCLTELRLLFKSEEILPTPDQPYKRFDFTRRHTLASFPI